MLKIWVWMKLCRERKLNEKGSERNILTVTVEDHGVGIENVEKAMEPMFTTRRDLERSGMGFVFMEAFMDSIKVESEVGVGTTVTMMKKIGRRYETQA